MTHTILRIDASMRGEGSVSRQLADELLAKLAADHVIKRDLKSEPLPLIDETWIGANYTPIDKRSDEQKSKLELSDKLVSEIAAADTLVIACPVYNFGVPAAMKAWVDLVCRAGVSFRYTEKGPEGLMGGKRAILVMASGGTPMGSDYDYASPYLKQMLGFIGITDVQLIAADTLMANPDRLNAARDAIEQLAA